MTASSLYSGTADNFWSRDDIRVRTFGGSPKAVEILAEGFCSRASRPAPQARSVEERKRRGSPSLRGVSSRRKTALAAAAPWRGSGHARTRMMWNATSAWSLTPSCANWVPVNTRSDRAAHVRAPGPSPRPSCSPSSTPDHPLRDRTLWWLAVRDRRPRQGEVLALNIADLGPGAPARQGRRQGAAEPRSSAGRPRLPAVAPTPAPPGRPGDLRQAHLRRGSRRIRRARPRPTTLTSATCQPHTG